MQNVGLGGGDGQGDRQGDRGGELSGSSSDSNSSSGEDSGEQKGRELNSREGHSSATVDHDGFAAPAPAPAATVLSIVISQPEEAAATKTGTTAQGISMGLAADKDDKLVGMNTMKKGVVRSESYHEQCRVCQQQSDEPLMDLGCKCRGELSKAHLSCIEIWFRTRGSNRCEICQQVAANVPQPESQPSTNYWIWRVDPAFGAPNRRAEHERGCFSPLWVAFCILIGGLLLDVLISVSLGVSALPVNIIIGVLIVLGLGTALRLALECCHGWSIRRNVQRAADTSVNSGYHPDV